jgi:RND family efflux transporter MFP subunit
MKPQGGGMVGRRKVRLLVSIVVLLSLGVSCTPDTSRSAEVESVSAATDYTQLVTSAVNVTRGSLRPTVVSSGIVQGQSEVLAVARTPGIVEAVHFDLGTRVNQGDTLVTLDSTVAALSMSQIERQVENARSALEVDRQLFDRGAISRSTLNQTQATLYGLEAQLARSQETVRDSKITAAMAGYIAEQGSTLHPGDTLQAGQTIARIIDLDNLRVSLSLGQSQIFSVAEGAEAKVDISTPTGPISTVGSVRAISAGSDPRTGSWTVLVDFQNPEPRRIRAGVSARVTILNSSAEQYLLVPNAALVNREGSTYVYVMSNGSAELTAVRVIDRYGDKTAIEPEDDGMDLEGMAVLTTGLSRVNDGASVVTQYQ